MIYFKFFVQRHRNVKLIFTSLCSKDYNIIQNASFFLSLVLKIIPIEYIHIKFLNLYPHVYHLYILYHTTLFYPRRYHVSVYCAVNSCLPCCKPPFAVL